MSISYSSLEKATVYYILKNSTIAEKNDSVPNSFYLIGHMENGQFILDENRVLGEGKLAKAGRPGWLEINSNQFYSQETPRSVTSPYIKGYMTEEGFIPSTEFVR